MGRLLADFLLVDGPARCLVLSTKRFEGPTNTRCHSFYSETFLLLRGRLGSPPHARFPLRKITRCPITWPSRNAHLLYTAQAVHAFENEAGLGKNIKATAPKQLVWRHNSFVGRGSGLSKPKIDSCSISDKDSSHAAATWLAMFPWTIFRSSKVPRSMVFGRVRQILYIFRTGRRCGTG